MIKPLKEVSKFQTIDYHQIISFTYNNHFILPQEIPGRNHYRIGPQKKYESACQKLTCKRLLDRERNKYILGTTILEFCYNDKENKKINSEKEGRNRSRRTFHFCDPKNIRINSPYHFTFRYNISCIRVESLVKLAFIPFLQNCCINSHELLITSNCHFME